MAEVHNADLSIKRQSNSNISFQGTSSKNYATETEESRDAFEKRMIEKAEAAQKVLSKLSSWTWKCDTPESDQLENETYIKFSELLQVSYAFNNHSYEV